MPLCCLFFFALRLLITPLVSSNSCQNLGTDNRVMSDELVLKRVFQIYYVLYINRSRIWIRNFVNDVAAKDFSVKILRCNLTTNYYQSNFAFQNKSFVNYNKRCTNVRENRSTIKKEQSTDIGKGHRADGN